MHPSFLVSVRVKLAEIELLVEYIGNLNTLVKSFYDGLE
jgi:hypothetical protein